MRAQARCVPWTIPASGSRTTRSCCCRPLSGFSRAPAIERLPRRFRPPSAASGNRWTHSAAAATAPPKRSSRRVPMKTACRGDMRGPRLIGPAPAMALDRHTSDRLNCWRRSTMPRWHCAPRPSAARVRAGFWLRRSSHPRAWTPCSIRSRRRRPRDSRHLLVAALARNGASSETSTPREWRGIGRPIDRQATAQHIGEHGRVAVLGITRGEDNRDDARARAAAQLIHGLTFGVELGAIAPTELREALRSVPVPPSQLRARRKLASPQVDGGARPGNPSWPDAVHEDPVAVATRGRFVDAFGPDRHVTPPWRDAVGHRG